MEAKIGFDGNHRPTDGRSTVLPRPEMVSRPAQTLRIMVAVELALLRCGLAELVRRVLPNVEIIEADDLATASQLLDAGSVDVLIADVEGAGPDAKLLLQQISLECPDLRIAVLVGPSDQRASALSWLEAGAHGCLPKAASPEELCEALRIIRAGNGYVSASLFALSSMVLFSRTSADSAALTTRQQDVLRLLTEGRSSKDIARRLGLSVSTVKAHLAAAYRSLGAHNRVEAVVRCRGDQGSLA